MRSRPLRRHWIGFRYLRVRVLYACRRQSRPIAKRCERMPDEGGPAIGSRMHERGASLLDGFETDAKPENARFSRL